MRAFNLLNATKWQIALIRLALRCLFVIRKWNTERVETGTLNWNTASAENGTLRIAKQIPAKIRAGHCNRPTRFREPHDEVLCKTNTCDCQSSRPVSYGDFSWGICFWRGDPGLPVFQTSKQTQANTSLIHGRERKETSYRWRSLKLLYSNKSNKPLLSDTLIENPRNSGFFCTISACIDFRVTWMSAYLWHV